MNRNNLNKSRLARKPPHRLCVSVPRSLYDRMIAHTKLHPEINWSAEARKAFEAALLSAQYSKPTFPFPRD